MLRVWLQRYTQCGMEHECAVNDVIDLKTWDDVQRLEAKLSGKSIREMGWYVTSITVLGKEAQ